MFLSEFNYAQKSMFAALAKRMVLADWRFEDHEKAAIARVEAEMGASFDVETKDLMGNDNLVVFETDEQRYQLIYELMVLAHSDLRIDASERHVFDDLATDLRLDNETFKKLEELSIEGFAILNVDGDESSHRDAVLSVIKG